MGSLALQIGLTAQAPKALTNYIERLVKAEHYDLSPYASGSEAH